MNLGLAGVVRGLPGLFGVLAGIVLYARPIVEPAPAIPAVLLVVLIVALYLSREVFITAPRLALLLLEPWVLSSVCIVALCTQALLCLTLRLPGWFALDKASLNAVSGALLGAISTYLATTWTKEIGDSKGPFLPGTQFKEFLAARFLTHHQLTGDRVEVEACDSEVVARKDISGWSLKGRWRRAGVLAKYLEEQAAANGSKGDRR